MTLSQPAGSDKTWKLACDHLQAGKAMDSKVFGYSSGYKGDRDREKHSLCGGCSAEWSWDLKKIIIAMGTGE